MDVIIRGPMYDPSGYSYVARKLAIAAFYNGLGVHALHIPNNNVTCPLTTDESSILQQMEQYPISATAPLLSVCLAHSFVFDIERVSMGLSMLESTKILPLWARHCNQMDMTLVPSTFNRDTFIDSGVSPSKLLVFPLGVDTDVFNPTPSDVDVFVKQQFLPEGSEESFIFFSNFEWIARKNPTLLLDAFCQSFDPDENVMLMLKVYNGGVGFDKAATKITETIREYLNEQGYEKHPKIIVIPGLLDEQEMSALYRISSCYVTPSSGEGWCLPISESMATGKPAIATNWSAYLDYLNEENGYLIDVAEMIDVPEFGTESDFLYRNSQWSMPSLDSLKKHMRHVFDNQEEVAIKGTYAKETIENKYTWKHAAQRLRDILVNTENAFVPKERQIKTTVNEKLNVGIVVPSLERKVCGIKEYTMFLKDGIGDRANVFLTDKYGRGAGLEHCQVVNYQFEYSLFQNYFLERELAMIDNALVSITVHSVAKNMWKENDIITSYADQVIVHNEDSQKYLSRNSNLGNVICIPHGCPDGVTICPKEPTDTLIIGSFGTTQPQKGLSELALAIDYLNQHAKYNVEARIFATIADNIDSKSACFQLEKIIDKYKLNDIIKWNKEFLDVDTIVSELKLCDIIVLPYKSIALQMAASGAVRIAMLAGRPILITDATHFKDLIRVLFTVREKEISDPSRLARFIDMLYTNDGAQQKTLHNMEDYAKKNSWAKIGERHVASWEHALKLYRRKQNV